MVASLPALALEPTSSTATDSNGACSTNRGAPDLSRRSRSSGPTRPLREVRPYARSPACMAGSAPDRYAAHGWDLGRHQPEAVEALLVRRSMPARVVALRSRHPRERSRRQAGGAWPRLPDPDRAIARAAMSGSGARLGSSTLGLRLFASTLLGVFSLRTLYARCASCCSWPGLRLCSGPSRPIHSSTGLAPEPRPPPVAHPRCHLGTARSPP